MALIKGVKDEYLILAGAAVVAASLVKINIAPITLGGLSGGSSQGSSGAPLSTSGYTFVPATLSAGPSGNIYNTDVEGLAALGASLGSTIPQPQLDWANAAYSIMTHNSPWFAFRGY